MFKCHSSRHRVLILNVKSLLGFSSKRRPSFLFQLKHWGGVGLKTNCNRQVKAWALSGGEEGRWDRRGNWVLVSSNCLLLPLCEQPAGGWQWRPRPAACFKMQLVLVMMWKRGGKSIIYKVCTNSTTGECVNLILVLDTGTGCTLLTRHVSHVGDLWNVFSI